MIEAVIFDLDGTALSNEDEYGNAFKTILGRLGRKVDITYPHIGGIGVKENWPILLAKYKITTQKSIEELTKETQDAYLEQLPKVTLKPGFENFVRELKKGGVMVALATSNAWWILDEVFAALDLEKYFDATSTGEEVEHRKPAPDLFILTADKLGVSPENCLVIEDSEAGIDAAHKAKMKAVGIARDNEHARTLKRAEMVAFRFDEISVPEMLNL